MFREDNLLLNDLLQYINAKSGEIWDFIIVDTDVITSEVLSDEEISEAVKNGSSTEENENEHEDDKDENEESVPTLKEVLDGV